MNWFMAFSVAMICIGICYWLIYYYQRHVVSQVVKQLYEKNDPIAAAKALKGPFAELLIPKRTRLLMLVDIYIVSHNSKGVRDTFALLKDTSGINTMSKIDLHQKELSFYAMENDAQEAEAAYNKLMPLLADEKLAQNSQVQALKDEANQLMEVYIRRNTAFIETLEALVETTDNVVYQGIYYYRLAKLYYYKEDEAACRANLEKAKTLVKDTELEGTITYMLEEDISQIAVK